MDTNNKLSRIDEKVTWGDSRLPLNFWNKVQVEPDGCWLWTGAHSRTGYSSFGYKGKSNTAHRVAYIALIGPIPGTFPHGLTIDHLCRNRLCVNPAHMELVSRGENSLRGNTIVARYKNQTHCINGHEFTPENTGRVPSRNNARCCKACQKIRRDRFNQEQRERKGAAL
jgi:hypothetical protein